MSYPIGTEYDSRAPWNYQEPHRVRCEACDGKGKNWYAYDFVSNTEVECTETTWNLLPDTEEEARSFRGKYVKSSVDICPVCHGEGEVEYEEDFEPDYDD